MPFNIFYYISNKSYGRYKNFMLIYSSFPSHKNIFGILTFLQDNFIVMFYSKIFIII